MKIDKLPLNRRQFIKRTLIGTTGLLAFPTIVPATVLGRTGKTVPNDRIVMGMIGVGNMGTGHVRSFLGHADVQIISVCDVRKAHRDRAKARIDQHYGNQDCTTYNDFRELLAREDIDAVCIATPDHWHVLVGLEAAEKGKHMYFEKPLGLGVEQAKVFRRAVQRNDVIFQFGTQQRSNERFRLTCELVRNGKIGELQKIMIGSANYKQIPDQPEQPVPEGFDYDFWLGPAPWAPYTYERCTRNWTLLYDYSLGCVSGAWGIHHVDIAQWANNSDDTYPLSVEAEGTFPEQGFYDTAIAWKAVHQYANGVQLIHMDMPTALKHARQFELHWMGMLFLGTEGWIYVAREFFDAEPKSLLRLKLGPNDFQLPVSRDHRRNFLDAIKSGKQPLCPVDIAARSDIICHHADIAMRLGRKLTWDLNAEQFIDDIEANRLLDRPMRSPWHL